MSEMLATQCPHCQTRFRLTEEQMRAAGGKVRCGACLKIFSARPDLAGTEERKLPPPPASSSPSPSPRSSLMIHDDLELDQLDLEALGLDESILEDIKPAPAAPTATAASPGTSSLAEPGRQTPHQPDLLEQQAAGAEPEPTQPAVIGASDISPPLRYSRLQQSTEEYAEPPRTGRRQRPLQAVRDEHVADHLEDDLDYPVLRNVGLIAERELQDELLYEDDPRPVRRRSRSNGLWTLLSLLALLGLAGQYLTYNFTALASDQRSRPLLEKLCLIGGCKLPAQVDIGQLRSSNLVVRPHPEFPGTLAIDLILYNRAALAQPFPILQMTFTDNRGRQISQRQFHPGEYLAGELAGTSLMPPQIPIHIGLSMLAPDDPRSSYALDFISP